MIMVGLYWLLISINSNKYITMWLSGTATWCLTAPGSLGWPWVWVTVYLPVQFVWVLRFPPIPLVGGLAMLNWGEWICKCVYMHSTTYESVHWRWINERMNHILILLINNKLYWFYMTYSKAFLFYSFDIQQFTFRWVAPGTIKE